VFADGSQATVEPYEGKRRIYHCGNQFIVVRPVEVPATLLVVVDANKATIGQTDGENIQVLWHETSMVPRKHKAGGQSQRRFERDRERALLQWLRHVGEQTRACLKDGQGLLVGGPGMTKDRYIKDLPI